MNVYVSVTLVMLASSVGFLKAIPIGIALELNAMVLAISVATGSIISLVILFSTGVKFKEFIFKKIKKRRMRNRIGKLQRLFDSYGFLGLGIIGTLILGPQMTLIVGLSMTRKHKKLLVSILFCTVLWTSFLTVLFAWGSDIIYANLA